MDGPDAGALASHPDLLLNLRYLARSAGRLAGWIRTRSYVRGCPPPPVRYPSLYSIAGLVSLVVLVEHYLLSAADAWREAQGGRPLALAGGEEWTTLEVAEALECADAAMSSLRKAYGIRMKRLPCAADRNRWDLWVKDPLPVCPPDVPAALEWVARTLGARAAASAEPARTAHSLDYRSVWWFGRSLHFTKTQAAVVALLWQAWEAGTPDVGGETLLEAVGSDSKRLAEVFKGHPAWGSMIVQGGTQGAYCLRSG
jgi:hypothetical protein